MISTESRRSSVFVGDGSTTAFPFPFKVFNADEVSVVVTDGTSTSSLAPNLYSVSLNEDAAGGVVTLESPLAEDSKLLILSAIPYPQGLALMSQGAFNTDDLNNAWDKNGALIQQVRDQVARAVTVPDFSDITPAEFTEALFTARDDAVNAATAAAQSEAESTKQAEIATEAAQTAVDTLESVKTEGKSAVDAIAKEGEARLAAVTAEGEKQVAAISQTGADQTQAVSASGSAWQSTLQSEGAAQVASVSAEGEKQAAAVVEAGEAQKTAIGTLGESWKDRIVTTGSDQISAVSDECRAQVAEAKAQMEAEKGAQVQSASEQMQAAAQEQIESVNAAGATIVDSAKAQASAAASSAESADRSASSAQASSEAASASASGASASAQAAAQSAKTAAFAIRICSLILTDSASAPLAAVSPMDNIKVGDAVVDAEGKVYPIVSLDASTFTVGAQYANIRGPQGPQGVQGEKGPRGDGVKITDAFDTEDEFLQAYPTGTEGQSVLVGNKIYVWSATEGKWVASGELSIGGGMADSVEWEQVQNKPALASFEELAEGASVTLQLKAITYDVI